MTPQPLSELVDPGWEEALTPVAPQIAAMGDFLRAEVAAGRPYLPAGRNVLRAFAAPLDEVKVLIVGQDPYPTPGHPVGLSFSVDPTVRPVPRSLQNIYHELRTDLGIPTPPNGDLTPWTRRGVMLLNRVLTVQAGISGSHRGKGWEAITEHAIRASGRAGRPARRGALGQGCRHAAAAAGRHPDHRLCSPEPALGERGILRLAPVQPGERASHAGRRRPGRLEPRAAARRDVGSAHASGDPLMLEEEYNPRRQLPPRLRPAPAPEPEFSFELRQATDRDVPHMLEIYNHYVLNSTVTFDEDRLTLKEMRTKFRDVERLGFPWLVAVSPTGMILGYAYVTPWKAKAAYRYTVEDSIYLSPAATGKGVGKALMARMLDDAKAAGIKEVIAVIADKGADASIAMHENFGFSKIGEMGKVGFKFGRWLGTVLMQKSLKGGSKR